MLLAVAGFAAQAQVRVTDSLLPQIAADFHTTVGAATASDKAVFQVPEMAHNILPTMVMSSFVDRVPRKAMSYLVYSQAEIGPERALSFGIVSDVIAAAKLDEAVETLCAAILMAPRPAICGVKEYIKTAPDMAVFGAVEFARNLHATINSSGDMRRKH